MKTNEQYGTYANWLIARMHKQMVYNKKKVATYLYSSLLMLLCLFSFTGCNNDETITYVTSDDLLNKNNITDVTGLLQRVEQEEGILYFGNRKGKDWFALFDNAGILQEEWYGKDRSYYDPNPIFIDLYYPFKKLKDNTYAFVYDFSPENIRQAVYLCENQAVEYGFVLENNNESIIAILNKDRFLSNYGNVYDFKKNIIANDVRLSNGSLSIGFQNDKVWVGYESVKKGWQEATGTEPFERNLSIHLGYGEYKNIYIKSIITQTFTETNWGFAFIPRYLDSKSEEKYNSNLILLCYNDNLYYFDYLSDGNSQLRNWYNETLLVDNKNVMSPQGELLAEFVTPVKDTDEATSLTDGIRFSDSYIHCCRINYQKNFKIWSVAIPQLMNAEQDARITMTILEKGQSIWKYNCKVINRDGSQNNFDFNLNIETGELND